MLTIILILIGLFILLKLIDSVGFYLPSVLTVFAMGWLSQFVWDWLCFSIMAIVFILNVFVVLKAKGEI